MRQIVGPAHVANSRLQADRSKLLGWPRWAAAQVTGTEAWRDDLQTLVTRLEAGHPNLYHTTTQQEFHASFDSLAARVGSLNDVSIITEVARLVATIGDGHTLVNLLWDSRLPFRRLPVTFARAADGLVILEATAAHEILLGTAVVRIGRLPADEALARVRPLYSYDNEWTSLQATELLRIPEILHATGVTSSADSTTLELATTGGGRRTVTLAAGPRSDVGTLNVVGSPEAAMWLRNRDDRYWLTALPDRRAVYVQFNGADYDKEDESVAQFGRRMERAIRESGADVLILDLRWNAGGSRWRARHLLNAVIRAEGYFGGERASRAREPGGRIFTIIGTGTFSAAVQFALDLDLHTNTVFVGEPTGGKPNHYGEAGRFRLPHSGLEIRYSTLYHQASDPRDVRQAILPDMLVVPAIEDYQKGRDAALEAIWTYRR